MQTWLPPGHPVCPTDEETQTQEQRIKRLCETLFRAKQREARRECAATTIQAVARGLLGRMATQHAKERAAERKRFTAELTSGIKAGIKAEFKAVFHEKFEDFVSKTHRGPTHCTSGGI